MVCQVRMEVVCQERPCVPHCCREGEVISKANKGQCGEPRDPQPDFGGIQLVKDEEGKELSNIPGREIKYLYESHPKTCVKVRKEGKT